jgi:asparagine synthase (glutamine-hydrolysing)
MHLEVELLDGSTATKVADFARWHITAEPDSLSAFRSRRIGMNVGLDESRVDVNAHRVTVHRGFSGEHPLYYGTNGQSVLVSDRSNWMADRLRSRLDLKACYEFIYFEYPGKERTLFESVKEVMNGQTLTFDGTAERRISIATEDGFALPTQELVGLNGHQLVTALRDRIRHAHGVRASTVNGVLLSGGIDSQVMAITLVRDLGLANTFAATFSVSGASQNESQVARRVATKLGMEWIHVEVDPNEEVDWPSLLGANSPYIGGIAMRALMACVSQSVGLDSTLFAGQDTRLHTPALSKRDLLLWRTIYRHKTLSALSAACAKAMEQHLPPGDESSYGKRALRLLASSPSFADFLANRYFHVRRFSFNEDSPLFREIYSDILAELYDVDTGDKRKTYNRIVGNNWRRQYLFDIGHMVTSCENSLARCALPFYDAELSIFAAQLPFDLAIKTTKGRAAYSSRTVAVNKFLLRKAYESELDFDLVFRDKAVALTNYMFFNGSLRDVLWRFCQDRSLTQSPEGVALHLPEIQSMCRARHSRWRPEDNWLCNIAFNALVVWKLMSEYEIVGAEESALARRFCGHTHQRG